MRKAGIKVRRASPGFLTSPNMDRIIASVLLFEYAFGISARSG